MQLKYHLLKEDLLEAKRKKFLESGQTLYSVAGRFLLTFFLAYVAMKGYYDYKTYGGFYFILITVLFGAGAVAFFALYHVIREKMFVARLKKRLDNQVYQSIIGEQEILLEDGTFTYKKGDFTDVKEGRFLVSQMADDMMVYLFIDKINAYLIPKRAFGSQEQQAEFMNLIKLHLIEE